MIKITKTRNEMCVDDDKGVEVQDPVIDWLIRSMKTAQTGTIKLDIEGKPAVKIEIVNYGNNIMVDLLQNS
jgi:hypothetical protein